MTTSEQQHDLATLAAVAATLNVAEVRYWVMGGWAVDLHVGRVTRPHSDIDLAVVLDDRPALHRAVARNGFTPTEQIGPGIEWFSGRRRLEGTSVQATADGSYVTPGYEAWPYAAGALGTDTVSLHGVEVAVMSVDGLLDTKQSWQTHMQEPPRPHDLVDIEALRAVARTRASAPPRAQSAPKLADSIDASSTPSRSRMVASTVSS